LKTLALLPWDDWLALFVFFLSWTGYAWFARYWADKRPSLLNSTNHFRKLWMMQSTARDPRVLDGIITQSLASSSSFFASTTVFIIGGLAALLGTTEKAVDLVREIPFAKITPMLVFDFKIMVLLGIFVYAFFRFSWAMRQYTIVGLLVGAMPPAKEFLSGAVDSVERDKIASRAGRLLGVAAETFNDGLRAYYFSFAALGWFFSPLIFMLCTAVIVAILYFREFKSEVLAAIQD
jgi:uncharacterized membrane protein